MLVATAVQKSVPVQIRAVGNVEAYNTVSIKSQVTGVLQKAHFKEGQDVKAGDLLFVGNQTAKTITHFSINSDGTLTSSSDSLTTSTPPAGLVFSK